MFSSTWNVQTRIDLILPNNTHMLMPGEQATARLTLLCCMPLLIGQSFSIRELKSTVATGVITKVHDKIHFDKRKMNKIVIAGINDGA